MPSRRRNPDIDVLIYTRRAMRRVLPLLLGAACSGPSGDDMPPPNMCNAKIVVEDPAAPVHVPVGTQIEWSNNPPTSGMHYPYWAAWNRQYAMLDRGYYVHNLEHGGVVLLYRCDAGCPDVVAQLVQVANGLAKDPSCGAALPHRVIITGDPLLPAEVQVAAVTWGHAYTAECYDAYIGTFAQDHYNQGPEDTCADGINLAGTSL